MIFLVMLTACSLLINDAVQLDTYKPHYDKFALNRNDKRSLDDNFCELRCNCPRGPAQGTDYNVFNGSALSESKGKYLEPEYTVKRSDETAPRGMDTIYSIWRRSSHNYPSPLTRKIFD